MGESFQFIDIVLFAMVAAFLVLRLRSVLGRHRDSGRSENNLGFDSKGSAKGVNEQIKSEEESLEQNQELLEEEEPNNIEKNLKLIKDASPEFDTDSFIDGVKAAFEIIVEAFAQGKKDRLRELLSNDVYSNFARAIDVRDERGESLDCTLVRIEEVTLLEAETTKSQFLITTKIISEQINVIRNTEKEVVEGSPDFVSQIIDIWTFSRDISSSDPNWELIATRSLE